MFLGALGLALLLPACGGTDDAVETVPALDPSQVQFGKSYEDWTVAWWRWAMSVPGSVNPVLDTTGEFCHEGQDDASPVFFLAGTVGGTVARTCAAAKEKAIFFPVLNNETDNTGAPSGAIKSDQQLLDEAPTWFANVKLGGLRATVDGKSVANVTALRFGPTLFTFDVPPGDNIFTSLGVPDIAGPVTGVSVGYWVMLAPLSVGKHSIVFGDAGITAKYSLTQQ